MKPKRQASRHPENTSAKQKPGEGAACRVWVERAGWGAGWVERSGLGQSAWATRVSSKCDAPHSPLPTQPPTPAAPRAHAPYADPARCTLALFTSAPSPPSRLHPCPSRRPLQSGRVSADKKILPMTCVTGSSSRLNKPGSVRCFVALAAWRSFLWDARYRAPRAAYPEARAGSPRTPLYVALLRMGFTVP